VARPRRNGELTEARGRVAAPIGEATSVDPSPAGSVLRSREELAALHDEWLDLYRRSGTPNPFAHPAWVTAWLEHYTAEDALYVVTIRSGEQLVAVAPFHRRRVQSGGVALRLGGAGTSELLTEIPELLVDGAPRKLVRELCRFLLHERRDDWDWAELRLVPAQGWFESDWLTREAEAEGAKFVHTGSAAFVIVDLPDDWDELRGNLKRNMKEAIRRSTNRLARVGWESVTPATRGELDEAVESLVRLHAQRSDVTDKERHVDYFADDHDLAFLRKVGPAMFEAGAGSVQRIRIEGADAAARLVLRGNGSIFFSVAGLDPDYWDYGPGTMLVVEALRQAIARGDTSANLSMNPDEGKLRWSERIEVHNAFMLVAPRRRSRVVSAAHLVLRTLRQGYALSR
jgi:CelD/BcsL family acetyltransferase involved in cellulose biosynthesis